MHLKAVPCSPLDANMLAHDATRLELCGCNLKRAYDGLFSALDGTNADIASETASFRCVCKKDIIVFSDIVAIATL